MLNNSKSKRTNGFPDLFSTVLCACVKESTVLSRHSAVHFYVKGFAQPISHAVEFNGRLPTRTYASSRSFSKNCLFSIQ